MTTRSITSKDRAAALKLAKEAFADLEKSPQAGRRALGAGRDYLNRVQNLGDAMTVWKSVGRLQQLARTVGAARQTGPRGTIHDRDAPAHHPVSRGRGPSS